MEPDESPEEDGPLFAYVHPDDRLWRHPSEVAAIGPERPAAVHREQQGRAPDHRPALVSRTWAVAVLAGLVGAMVASGVLTVAGELSPRSTTVLAPVTKLMTPNTLASAAVDATSLGGVGWPAIVDAVAPSVAAVTAWAAGGPVQGSAVVYGSDQDHDVTYLLTDAQLIEDADPIEVTFNGGEAVTGHVMRIDPTSGLALVWVSGGGRATPALGSVDTLHDADGVMTLGGRSGGDSATIAGSVSSLDRTVVDEDDDVATCGLLAVSSTVPAGDDGGAVIDDQGSVVGIATSLASSDPADAGMSFAVPIDEAVHVAEQIIADARVTHPWIGIDATSDLDSATADAMGLRGGAEVLDVAPDSPAAAADLGPDDVVTSLDGHPVTSSGTLLSLLADTAPGQLATLTWRRGGSTATARVRITDQPADLGS